MVLNPSNLSRAPAEGYWRFQSLLQALSPVNGRTWLVECILGLGLVLVDGCATRHLTDLDPLPRVQPPPADISSCCGPQWSNVTSLCEDNDEQWLRSRQSYWRQ